MAITDSVQQAIDAVKLQMDDAQRGLDEAVGLAAAKQGELLQAKAQVDIWKATKAGLRDALTLLKAEQAKRDAGTSLAPDLFTTPATP